MSSSKNQSESFVLIDSNGPSVGCVVETFETQEDAEIYANNALDVNPTKEFIVAEVKARLKNDF